MDSYNIFFKVTHPKKNPGMGFSDSRDHSTVTMSFLTYLEKILIRGVIRIMISRI